MYRKFKYILIAQLERLLSEKVVRKVCEFTFKQGENKRVVNESGTFAGGKREQFDLRNFPLTYQNVY